MGPCRWRLSSDGADGPLARRSARPSRADAISAGLWRSRVADPRVQGRPMLRPSCDVDKPASGLHFCILLFDPAQAVFEPLERRAR